MLGPLTNIHLMLASVIVQCQFLHSGPNYFRVQELGYKGEVGGAAGGRGGVGRAGAAGARRN